MNDFKAFSETIVFSKPNPNMDKIKELVDRSNREMSKRFYFSMLGTESPEPTIPRPRPSVVETLRVWLSRKLRSIADSIYYEEDYYE